MEISEVRQRLRQTIDRARRRAAERRGRADAAGRQYEEFLSRVVTPVFRMMAMALKAEGHPFAMTTPQGRARLVSERDPSDFLEVELDVSGPSPRAMGRAVHTIGRRVTTVERPIREGAEIADLTEEDLLQFLLTEIEAFVER